jgi:hypothetical protein
MKSFIFKKYFSPISVIKNRILQKQLWSIGLFIAISVSLVAASLILVNEFQVLELNIIAVKQQILAAPILVMSLIISLFLGISASVNFSREYDKGTLELLFFGPVDEIAYILASFWAQIQLFGMCIIDIFIWSNVIVWLFNLNFDLNVLLILLGCVLMAMEIIAFGILSAVWGGKTRNSLVVYILFLLIIGGVQIGDNIVSSMVTLSSSTITDPLIFLRNVLKTANNILKWVSPYAQLQRSIQALLNGVWFEFGLILALMLFEGGLLLIFSIHLLKVKGVRPTS